MQSDNNSNWDQSLLKIEEDPFTLNKCKEHKQLKSCWLSHNTSPNSINEVNQNIRNREQFQTQVFNEHTTDSESFKFKS